MTDIAHLGFDVDSSTAVKATSDLDRLGDQAAITERQVTGAAGKSSKAFSTMAASARSAGTGFRSIDTRMISMQLSQVAQQAAAGGGVLRALAIQLPDIGLAFGTVGIAAGVVAGALLPVVQTMWDTSAASDDLDDNLADLSDAIAALQAANKLARSSFGDLRDEFGLNAAAARDMLTILAELEQIKAIKAMSDGMQEFREVFAATQADLTLVLASFDEAFAAGGIRAVQAIEDLDRQFGMTYLEAKNLQSALDQMSLAAGPQEVKDATRAVSDALLDAYGTVGKIPPEMLLMAEAAAGVNVEALRLLEAQRLTGDSAADVADTFMTAADNAEGLAWAVESVETAIRSAADAATDFLGMDGVPPWIDTTIRQLVAMQAWIASMAQPIGVSGYAGGRGGDPRTMGGSIKDWQTGDMAAQLAYAPVFTTPKVGGGRSGGGGGGGGGGGVDPLLAEAERIFDDTRTAAEEYAAELEHLNELHDKGYIDAETYVRAIDQADEKFREASEAGEEFSAVTDLLKDAILDFAMDGEVAMDRLTESIKRAALEALLFGEGPLGKLFGGTGGGGILGMIFGGARAEGGPVSRGRAYVVGENGPELFTPNTSGEIIPNGSGVQKVVVEVYVRDDGTLGAVAREAGAVGGAAVVAAKQKTFAKDVQTVIQNSGLRGR